MVQMDFHLDYEIPDETLSSFSKSLSINHTITELQIEEQVHYCRLSPKS